MIRRRVVQPILDLLRQGITPEKVALTVALGVALGVTPILGSTTGLCTLAAIALRLNLPAIQLVNWIMYPVQLVLIVPFLRAGASLFGDRHLPALSVSGIVELIRTDVWQAVTMLGSATVHALAAWLLFASLLTAILYAIMVPLLKIFWRRQARTQ